MSADACVAYFGLRYEVRSLEIDGLELRSDARQIAARNAGLSSYWANFAGSTERYVLFVGARMAILGPENESALSVSRDRLAAIITDTIDRLKSAGLEGDAELHLEWLEDS